MTYTFMSKMVGKQEVDSSVLRLPTTPSPTKGKPKSVRTSNRGKSSQDSPPEKEKNRVRFGGCSYLSPRGSPNAKSRGNPSRSPRQSPTSADKYAGFSDSPAPAALPKPPSHWMRTIHMMTAGQSCQKEAVGFASNMKLLLNIQA